MLPEDGIDPYDNVLEWNFHTLTEKGKNKIDILSHLEQNNYKPLNLGLSPDFWSSHFLGFHTLYRPALRLLTSRNITPKFSVR